MIPGAHYLPGYKVSDLQMDNAFPYNQAVGIRVAGVVGTYRS